MDWNEGAFSNILDYMTGREGEITSTSAIKKAVQDDPSKHDPSILEAIEDLVVLGELTLVWAQQSGRVVLNESVDPSQGGQLTLTPGAWQCYIAKNHKEKYHYGLCDTKESAKEYLRQVVGDQLEELEQVPVVNNVYATQISGFEAYGTHTVVIRGERLKHQPRLQE
jgi:hypothetical protein